MDTTGKTKKKTTETFLQRRRESKISRDLAMELTSSASKLQMEDINLG
jgi:hypothetical protein